MAEKLRTKLVDNAFNNGKPVTYSTAAGWISDEPGYAHTKEFANLLGDVSQHEYDSNPRRPFLSATVIYQTPSGTAQYDPRYGDGLINRAMKMGLDNDLGFDPLRFGRDQEKAAFKFWVDRSRYMGNRGDVMFPEHGAQDTTELLHAVPFFTTEDMNAYHVQAGAKYENRIVGEDIKGDIIAKIRYWQEQLLNRFGMARTNVTDRWQQSGNVKKYIWARLNRPEDDATDVFFTVDAMGSENRLKVRLGYNFGNNNHFSDYQKARLEKITGSNTDDRIFYVPTSELHSYDGWDSLLADTNAFIDDRWSDYEAAVAYVRGINHASVMSRSRTQLIPPAPNDSSEDDDTDNPIDPTGSGQDFAALAQRRHEIGEEGESYVLDVLAAEMPDWSFGTMIAGSRYDIKGTRGDTEILEIEVKSTTSTNEGAPFFLSSSELEYVKQTPNKYYLYRVTGLGTNQQKVAYRLSRDQLLARDMQCNGYMVAGK